MDYRIFCTWSVVGGGGTQPGYVTVYAVVFDTDGNIVDNPWGSDQGAYNTLVPLTLLSTPETLRAAVEADCRSTYQLQGQVEFVWLNHGPAITAAS